MSTNQILQIVYAGVAIFGTYLTAARLLAGDWVPALWPLAIVLFCVYRLVTIGDDA